jgi:hypothetical protein
MKAKRAIVPSLALSVLVSGMLSCQLVTESASLVPAGTPAVKATEEDGQPTPPVTRRV